jgi:hypothetical protein
MRKYRGEIMRGENIVIGNIENSMAGVGISIEMKIMKNGG